MNKIRTEIGDISLNIPDPEVVDKKIITPLMKIIDLFMALTDKAAELFIAIRDGIDKIKRTKIDDTVDTVGNILIQRILLKELRREGLDDSWYKLIFNSDKGVWLKNGRGVFVAINKALIGALKLSSSGDILGRTGNEILQTGSDTIRKDVLKASLLANHALELSSEEDGIIVEGTEGFKIYKYGIRNTEGTVIAYLGMMFEPDLYKGDDLTIKKILKGELLVAMRK